MGLLRSSCTILLCWLLTVLFLVFHCAGSDISVKFLKAPRAFSHRNTATFVFQVLARGYGICRGCRMSCKLDDGSTFDCGGMRVFYPNLQDGNHRFEVCSNGSGVGCATYNWTVDTVPPTAYVTASTSFTNGLNVSVNISFTEPCTGGGGFGCSSVNACNLLVYGAGQVIPSSLITLQPNLRYSLLVGLSSTVQYGRVIVVMDKNFCTDTAGNIFKRSKNSSFYVHFDRRNVFVDLRTHVPERLVLLNNQTRAVQATNVYENLKVYLYFSEPVLNSSADILKSINISQGALLPINSRKIGNRRFGYLVSEIGSIAIIRVTLDSKSIISRQGTPVSPVAPVAFLYDSERPMVRLSTTSRLRTKEHYVPISIKFTKPVFGFNSSFVAISGGHLLSFHELSRSIYMVEIQADGDIVSISVPENITGDVAGNTNLASNILRVRHYSVPLISSVTSAFATAAFLATSFYAGLLTVSTSSLQSAGAFSRPSHSLTSFPARNLFRCASHIQVFALSRWLSVTLPVEFYEFARCLHWSIPYFSLPWESGDIQSVMVGSSPPAGQSPYSSKIHDFGIVRSIRSGEENMSKADSLYGLPLSPMEYMSFFEAQDKPEAEYILEMRHSSGWRDFNRSMFWLAVIGGSLILLHALLLLLIKFRKKSSGNKRDFGALIFPRFEIFLTILALPCICEASAALIRGGEASGTIVGILLLGAVAFLLLALLLFLSIGITFGKLLQYKEVHQEGQRFHWYQEIVRVTLGPGKRGQWTWKNQPSSVYLTMLGPLFEDLRGPPKYMLSQISGSNPRKQSDHIIASDDETEDAEAPFIQKLFGILRIYYTLLETVKRVSLGIIAGAYLDNWSSRTPTVFLVCITSFQLFFLVLKKPFIKKKVQLVEIICVSCEVGLFATCLVLLKKEFSAGNETKVGIFMILLLLVGFLVQMINEWYALYKQTKGLGPNNNSILVGLKMASIGFLLIFIPKKFVKNFESKFPVNQSGNLELRETSSSTDRNRSSGSRSSGTTDKPWTKQLRELAKASFSKDGGGSSSDIPSSSRSRWSGFWGTKRGGNSPVSTSADFKSKPRGLYKDLEAIFASK